MAARYNQLLEAGVSEATCTAVYWHELDWMNWAYYAQQKGQQQPRPGVSEDLKTLVKGESEAFKREFLKRESEWRAFADKMVGRR